MLKKVRKRDRTIADFDQTRITKAIQKAMTAMGEIGDYQQISDQVVKNLISTYGENALITVEEIQDIVEKTISDAGYFEVSKAYILYRKQREHMRKLGFILQSTDITENYINGKDWYVKENANMAFSLQGLNNYLSSKVISQYWLMRIYSPEVRKAHVEGSVHLHDLPSLSAYCVGWDLRDLLQTGFKGVPGKVQTGQAKHFRSALGQAVNFLYTLQGESAGAQAFSNFDSYLAPFIRTDNLTYKQVVQNLQFFLYNMNVDTRVGFQTPFTNLTLDVEIPKFMESEAAVVAGKLQSFTYGDLDKEMEMFNKAYIKVMSQGDVVGRLFTFPIVTYNITKDFNWNFKELFELTAKYGTPYFSNFISSDMSPEDVRSMCCRLRIENKKLQRKGGGFFGANPLTGSIGVVTINLPQIGYLTKDIDSFLERLSRMMDIAKDSLEQKRKAVETFTEKGLYPYSKFYLRSIKQRFDKYWKNHFSTIGLIGMNEASLNLLGTNISTNEGLKFAIKVLTYMREKLTKYQEETDNLYNLEATPAEGATTRLAGIDKTKYPDIKVANKEGSPFYTNSSQLPVDQTDNLFEALENQNKLQPLYTGGTVFHVFLGEAHPNWKSLSSLIKKIANKTKLPYYTITPTFSICQTHGYISGKHETCPTCGKECEIYSRVVGYLRPVSQWNKGKKAEFERRKMFKTEEKVVA
jgi:anaerobic ribonucleoside-triphosphate reductase